MDLIQLRAVLALLLLAFWRGDGKEGIFLYLMAGVSTMGMGLSWRASYNTGFGVTLSTAYIGIGFYCILLAIYNVILMITRRR
jgi:hypothetical protein